MTRVAMIVLFLLGQLTATALVYERFEQDGKMGIRDDQGHVVVPASFEALGWSDGSFSIIGEITGYRKGTRWGLLNLKKELITGADYLNLTSVGGNYVRVKREVSAVSSKVGCINLKGEVVIPLQYDDLALQDLRAIVMVKDGARYQYGLVDLSNRTLLPTIYAQITPLGTLRYAVKNAEGKTALFSEEGKWVTTFDIDSLSGFRHDLAILYQGLHRGVIDRSGSVRVEPIYRDVKFEEPGSLKVRKADRWKVIDQKQKSLHQIEADDIVSVGVNRYRLSLNGKSGLIDSLFNILVPVQYDYIGSVADELFVAGVSGRYGLLRTNGSAILPIQYDSMLRDNHLLRVRSWQNNQMVWELFDTVGLRKTQKGYDWMRESTSGLYPVKQKGFAGAIDRTGVERIACVYDALDIYENAVAVKFKGLYGIISREDVWKVTPQARRVVPLTVDLYVEMDGTLQILKNYDGKIIYFTNNTLTVEGDHLLEKLPDGSEKSVSFQGIELSRRILPPPSLALPGSEEYEGLRIMMKDGKYGFVDARGRLRIANRYEGARNFNEGFASVRLLGKWGFINKSDEIVIHPAYDRTSDMVYGTAIVARNGKTGIIDREGNVKLELRYDSITRVDENTFIFFRKGIQGLADGMGKILLEPRFDSILPIANHQVIVSQGGKYGLLTRDGMSVFPLVYEKLIYQSETNTFFVRETYDWESMELK